ncbi:MAG: hypothetical protein PHS82_06130 [Lachnospiraceae bacterium]|nr:hypothetical protein [Lachnospiraceae bacterium]
MLNIFFKKPKKYSPDFNKTEYDNWLNFMSTGGTSTEWKALISKNNWKFKEDDTETSLRYEKEFRPIFNKYLAFVESIEKRWSTLYASKDYNSRLSDSIEKECYTAIDYYEKVRRIDLKYGKNPMMGSSPAAGSIVKPSISGNPLRYWVFLILSICTALRNMGIKTAV